MLFLNLNIGQGNESHKSLISWHKLYQIINCNFVLIGLLEKVIIASLNHVVHSRPAGTFEFACASRKGACVLYVVSNCVQYR